MSETRFADMLKYLRRSRGYTQAEFAKATGLSRSAIANYEIGNRAPDIETLELFADTFNVNMSTLLGREDNFKLPEDTLTPMQKELFLELQNKSDEKIAIAVKMLKAIDIL